MSDKLFPSGPWTGFYNYRPKDKHRMDLQLTFARGAISGEGSDDIGRFVVRGRYDAPNRECHWTKTYMGGHDVFYRGFREGKGIWGLWEIGLEARGGFHIWPQALGEDGGETGSAQQEQPIHPTVIRAPAPRRLIPVKRRSRLLPESSRRALRPPFGKLEIRNPKSETRTKIRNAEMSKTRRAGRGVSVILSFGHLDLLRISDFGFSFHVSVR